MRIFKLLAGFSLILCLLTTGLSQAAIYNWNGSVSDDWSTAGNWTVIGSSWTWPNEEFGNEYTNQDCDEINIVNGDTVSMGSWLSIDGALTGSNTAVLTLDNASTLNVLASMWIADSGFTNGQVDIINGSLLSVIGTLKAGDDASSVGTINITDGRVAVTDDLIIANRANSTGNLNLNIAGIADVADTLYIADEGGLGTVIVDNGIVNTGRIIVGDDGGEGVFILEDGTVTNTGDLVVAWVSIPGTYTQNKGTSVHRTIILGKAAGSLPIINLNGGVLQGENIVFTATTGVVNFTGGQLRIADVNEVNMQSLVDTGKINVSGASSYTIYTDGDYTVLDNPDSDVYAREPIYPEHVAVNHDPADNVLTWTAPSAVTSPKYNVYFSDDPNLIPEVSHRQTATSYTASLDYATTYYWRVDVEDPNSGTPVIRTGSVWWFTTKPEKAVIDPATPADVLVAAGEDAVFTVSATDPLGGSLSYQWYEDDDDEPGGEVELSGETDVTLTVTSADETDEKFYMCAVSNGGGTVDSRKARLTIKKMIGHWPFDGNLTDIEGGNDGGATDPNFATGIVGAGQAAVFVDNDDTVSMSTAALTTRFWTLSWWDNADPAGAGGTWETMIGSGITDGWEIIEFDRYQTNRYAIGFNITGGDYNYTPADEPIARGQWIFHSVTYDLDNMVAIWYLNGAEFAQDTDLNFTAFDSLFFVGNSRNGSQQYKGMIDDLRFYNYPLDKYEVATLYSDTKEEAVCTDRPEADITGDCLVTLEDFVLVAAEWLKCGRVPESFCP